MKRIALALCLLLALFVSGCAMGEKELSGEVVDYGRVLDSGEVYSIFLHTEDGKEYEIFLREDTEVVSFMAQVQRMDFLEGNCGNVLVNVHYQKIDGMYFALQVTVNGLRRESAMTLEDGTRIDVVEILFDNREYCLEDGTVLLHEQGPVGPENVHSGGSVSFDDLSETAQAKILEYYAEREPFYDVEELLERAYDDWYIQKSADGEFESYFVSQDISPTASNENIVCFLADVVVPGENGTASIREGAVFDRETGEHISGFDLFTCTREEVIDGIIEAAMIDDPTLEAEIRQKIRQEYLVLYPDGLEINFPEGSISRYEHSYGMGFDLEDKLLGLMQPWAVPDKGENTTE